MKIGIDATPLSVPRAGVGTYTANLIGALRATGEDEVVPLLQRPVHPSFAESRVGDGQGYPCPPTGPWSRLNRTVWMQTKLRRVIRDGGFDLCHFTNGVAPLGCRCPYVVTVHDAGLWLHPEYHYLRRLVSLGPLVPHVLRRARAVVTVSATVKEELLGLFRLPASKVRVIPQGVSPHFATRPSTGELSSIRSAYGLPERFILSVGVLEPRKNLVRLLEAYTIVNEEHVGRNVGLVLVGRWGWKCRPLRDALSRLDSRMPVRVLGPVSDRALLSLYHLATVLAFPSLYEGFGLPVVEAMTCGTPVLTSGTGALAEVSGDAAELVDPRRVESIAEGLRRILDDGDRAAELRRRGIERARSFTWSRAARAIRSLYLEVCDARAGRSGCRERTDRSGSDE